MEWEETLKCKPRERMEETNEPVVSGQWSVVSR
jgi:hypothetical protein